MNKVEKDAIKIGEVFDKIQGAEEKWTILVMLLTGFLIEEIKEDHYEACLKDIVQDTLDTINETKTKGLEDIEPEGNA